MENKKIRGYLKFLGYVFWRLPFFNFIRSWLIRTHFTVIHYHEIDPLFFKEHVVYLEKEYSIIPLQTIRDLFYDDSITTFPENSLVITFDDGWRSNYDLLPIIRNFNHPVTIFISTGFVGTDILPGARAQIQNYLHTQIESNDVNNSRGILNENEMMEMIDSGVNFQSHGVNHLESPYIRPNRFIKELKESKIFIERLTKKEVFAFSYPYNEANIESAKSVKKAGYKIARKGDRVLNSLESNKFLLSSIGIRRNCSVTELKKSLELAKIKTVLIWLRTRFLASFNDG